MKKYYLHNGTEQLGPFDINDLKAKGIKKNTSIWYEGVSDWTTADKIEELKDLLKTTSPPPFETKQTPPPIKKPQTEQAAPPKKKKNVVGTIFQAIGVFAALVVVAVIILTQFKKSGGTTHTDLKTYEEKVLTVEEIEQADPAKFLDASGQYKQNFWGTAMKVHGTIKNNATVANYKDVVVEVIFFSGTNTELDRKQYKIYDFFPAHSTKNFELKIDKPNSCKKLGWNAVSATPY